MWFLFVQFRWKDAEATIRLNQIVVSFLSAKMNDYSFCFVCLNDVFRLGI